MKQQEFFRQLTVSSKCLTENNIQNNKIKALSLNLVLFYLINFKKFLNFSHVFDIIILNTERRYND